MRRSQTLVFRLLGGCALLLLVASLGEALADTPEVELPAWFKKLDTDGDGKVSLAEWTKGGRSAEEFKRLDTNGDGFITPDEATRPLMRKKKPPTRIELRGGRAFLRNELNLAEDGNFFGKKVYMIYLLRIEKGKTYRIEQLSKAYQSVVVLQHPTTNQIVAWGFNQKKGEPAVMTYPAPEDGVYRVIVTNQDGRTTGPFTLSVRAVNPGEKDLPRWLDAMDADRDGQVSLREWLDAKRKREEFRKLDLNEDGFITADEAYQGSDVPQAVKKGGRVELRRGRAKLKGDVVEHTTEQYQGKKSFTALAIPLKRGRTYTIEMVSPEYYAFLYLESPKGAILAQHDSGGNNQIARIVHRPAESGMYRIIATSLGGFRTGKFNLTVVEGAPGASADLPKWFEELDTDRDGQVSMREWVAKGRKLEEFKAYDRDGDGFITRRGRVHHPRGGRRRAEEEGP
jgi:Ca2+-binding EF-hand superfamily protein